ncbi:helix-turn-helix domain-containing protein [Actinoplanes sp. RD1]|uniref:helix-turn-helix domain-containing protein n=1 Tax=Actinoplanes sp. RD1 TaxID=3064538 RepID=UPI002741E70E|nr:helix-turn-helix transcriptional regulator [Actinoplanes sp. RD1]
MASEDPVQVSIGDLAVVRLKEARRLRGWSTTQLAEHLNAAGAPRLTANVLQNLEAGRRLQAILVEELLILAFVLGVPGEFFLTPRDGERLRLLPGVAPEREQFLAWLRGQQPLAGVDPERYRDVAAAVLPPTGSTVDVELREQVVKMATAAFDVFVADSEQIAEQIAGKTREQVRQLLTELKTFVVSGASADDLTAQLDRYLNDLPR